MRPSFALRAAAGDPEEPESAVSGGLLALALITVKMVMQIFGFRHSALRRVDDPGGDARLSLGEGQTGNHRGQAPSALDRPGLRETISRIICR
jgi:hypothetical protein